MSDSTEPGAGRAPLDIRKYPNRRYYDTTHSRHLTLEEIRDLVREGHDVAVRDSRSGGDITVQVLAQILLELETARLSVFPVPLLIRIIRGRDRWLRDSLEAWFHQVFRAYPEVRHPAADGIPAPPPGRFAGASRSGVPPRAGASAGAGVVAEKSGPSRSAGGGSGGESELQRQMAVLRRQVAALERALGTGKGRQEAVRSRRRGARD